MKLTATVIGYENAISEVVSSDSGGQEAIASPCSEL